MRIDLQRTVAERRCLCFSLALACLLPGGVVNPRAATGQTSQNVAYAVGAAVRLPAKASERLVEPHIAVHPRDGRRFAAAAMSAPFQGEFTADSARVICVAFLSLDGGEQWSRHEFDATDCADPWVTFTSDGEVVLAILGRLPGAPRKELLIFRTTGGGRMWGDIPVVLGQGHDHPTILADNTSPARSNWLYLTSSLQTPEREAPGRSRRQVFIARSRDGGRSFDAPIRWMPSNLFLRAKCRSSCAMERS